MTNALVKYVGAGILALSALYGSEAYARGWGRGPSMGGLITTVGDGANQVTGGVKSAKEGIAKKTEVAKKRITKYSEKAKKIADEWMKKHTKSDPRPISSLIRNYSKNQVYKAGKAISDAGKPIEAYKSLESIAKQSYDVASKVTKKTGDYFSNKFKQARGKFGNIPIGGSLEIKSLSIGIGKGVSEDSESYLGISGNLGLWYKYEDHKNSTKIPFSIKVKSSNSRSIGNNTEDETYGEDTYQGDSPDENRGCEPTSPGDESPESLYA